jgi:hypothetical protein
MTEMGHEVGRDPADVDPCGAGERQTPSGEDQVTAAQRLGVDEGEASG